MIVQPGGQAHEALLKRVKALEEELKRVRNEKKETGRSPAEVELKDRKARDRKTSRNSWMEIYSETTALHKDKRLLGQEVETDDALKWRVKWAQRGAALSWLIALISWILHQDVLTAVFATLLFLFLAVLYYKNVSLAITKRLLQEINVVIIIMLALCNWFIDIIRGSSSFSSILGLLYLLATLGFVLIDTVKVKSRVLTIVIGFFFIMGNIYNIFNLIIGDWDQGVVLLKYTIQENDYIIMKRSTKRSIFIQIMLFSMSGIYTLFKDRKQELMIFVTEHIYRETGTASKKAEDKQSFMNSPDELV
eukprot:g5399.t1